MSSANKVRQAVLTLLAMAVLASFDDRLQTAGQIIPKEQECENNSYFNSAFYSCQSCGTNARQSSTSSKSNLSSTRPIAPNLAFSMWLRI